jgi:hypothetical protein
MATYYVRTAGGNSNAAATYSLTSGGGATGSVPTAADNVIRDGASGAFVINAAMVCRSYVETPLCTTLLTHNAGITQTIGDNTTAPSDIALQWSTSATHTLGNAQTSAIVLGTLQSTQQKVDLQGLTVGNITFGVSASTGSQYVLTSSFISSGDMTHGRCAFDTNNFNWQARSFTSSSTQVRSINFGSSTITLTLAGEAWTTTTTTNGTFNTGTSTIKLTGANASMRTNTFTFYNVEFNGGGNMVLNSGGNAATYNKLTINGTATQTDTLSLGGNNSHQINGELAIIGNSDVNRLLVFSPALGTQRSIVLGASAIFRTNSINFDLRDVAISGGATNARDFSAFTTVGDQQGNSGVTFPASVTNTFIVAGSTAGASRWSAGRIPLPQDDVVFTGSLAATMGVSCWGRNIDFSAYTGTLTRPSSNTPNTFFGNMTLGASMNMGVTPNTVYMEGRGRSTQTITSNGQTFFNATSNNRFDVYSPGGGYTLTDPAIFRPSSDAFGTLVTVQAGYLVTGAFAHQIGQVASPTTTYARTLDIRGTTFNYYNTGTVGPLNIAIANLTFLDDSSTIHNVNGISISTRTFTLAGLTMNATVNYTVTESFGTLSITGGGTLNVLNVASGRRVRFTSGVTTNITTRNIQGTVGGWGYQAMNPLASGIFISAPHSTALSVSGDITIKFKIQMMKAYNSGNIGAVVCKLNAGLTAGYCVRINGGTITIFAAGSQGSANANLTTVFNSGDIAHIKIQRRQSDGRTQFFTSPDDITYTQLGTNVTIASGVALGATTDLLYIGCRTINNDNMNEGRIYRVQIYSDITETTQVFDANFQTKPLFQDYVTDAALGAIVTIQPELTPGDGRVEVSSLTPTVRAAVPNASGAVASDGIKVTDIDASAGLPWYAGVNSFDGGNNLNVLFSSSFRAQVAMVT